MSYLSQFTLSFSTLTNSKNFIFKYKMLLPLKNQPTNQSISLLAGFALWTVFSPQNSDSCKKQNPISIIMNA